MLPHQRKIILASQSPRRKELLERAGFSIEVRPLDVDESWPPNLPKEEVAPYLARKKATAGRYLLTKSSDLLLTADSVVILENEIFNKPESEKEAKAMLACLSGSMHRVITGVCLASIQKECTFSGVSEVYMEQLTPEEIDYYVQKYKPYDKAGSYAIQEWIGLCKISRIEGTYSNIMGLPVDLVYKQLEHWEVESENNR